ncbi:MAG: outer membrane protein assembly factor BamE [Methylovulum sp.]|nr:outer membrane protein assembly factor BamE [Methylovulum sp.]
MSKLLFSFCLLASLSLASCSMVLNNLPGVYSLEIQQGNIVDQDMIDQLRPGMNKRQVLYIMGSPMLVDTFHQKRWDYVYSDQPKGEDRVQKRITLVFDHDQIIGIQGDLRPSAVPVSKSTNETTVDVPKRDLDRTLWEKITGLFGYDGGNSPSQKEPAALKPTEDAEDRSY